MNKVELDQLDRLSLLKRLTRDKEMVATTPHGILLTLREGVFVPVPETFQLIDIATNLLETNKDIKSVADIGTGTGIIAITLAKRFRERKFFASNISEKALQLSQKNAYQNDVVNIEFVLNRRGEWIKDLPPDIGFIVSNPPYIGDIEYNDPHFRKMYPEVQYEHQEAIRTFDPLGINPFLQILEQSEDMQTRFYLFQCNADFIQHLTDRVNAETFYMEKIKDRYPRDRFLLLRKK